MPVRTLKLTDFWADYEPVNDTSRPGIMISNHTSYYDMYVYLLAQENPCFLSKFSVSKIPIVGFYAMMHQVIFFKREETQQREKIMNIIRERINAAERDEYQPLMIFCEGTTTNGRGMMKFKRGAFELERPILVNSLFYESNFLPCLTSIKAGSSALLNISQFSNKVTYFRFDQAIDPLWILQKHGRKSGMEGNWEIIAKEIKELMSFAFDLENCNFSYEQKIDFDSKVLGMSKEQLLARSN